MGYYCNECKKDISLGIFRYSMDKFGRALCMEHQEVERRTNETSHQLERQDDPILEQEFGGQDPEELVDSDGDNIESASKSGSRSMGKKIAGKMGKGVVKGVKKNSIFF